MTPTNEAIEADLLALARRELRLDRLPALDADLAQLLDSVQRLTLVVAIEDHFEIAFDDEDDAQVTTLAQAVAAVQRRPADRGADA